MSYGSIGAPWWDDRPVAVLGGGPSLKGFDFERLRGCHVLAVKGCMFDAPWADAGFGLDMPRYQEWRDKLAKLPGRIYWAVPIEQLEATGPPPSENVTFLQRLVGQSVGLPSEIYGGGTSGYGALQICIHKRAKRIVLFGFDYDGAFDPNASFRHNDQHYVKRRAQVQQNWIEWAEHFETYRVPFAERGIECWNACPQSKIETFFKVSIERGVALCA
jgi:hypothetical protein